MATAHPVNGHAPSRLVFIREFLKHPGQIQSVVPSSRFLRRRIVEAAQARAASLLVELGPGTGGTTRALLAAMPRQARLLSIEINESFHAVLNGIDDDRLIAHLGSADELREIMAGYDLDAPDAVVSGIPFSALSHGMGTRIVAAVTDLLAPHGRFVAYQVRNRVASLCGPELQPRRTETEFLNIPPMRVFQWEKPGPRPGR